MSPREGQHRQTRIVRPVGSLTAVRATAGRLALFGMLMLLAGCFGRPIEAVRGIEPVGPEFTRALAEAYRDFALYEADEMYDWPDAAHFARKGLDAAAGEAVEAERLEDWRLPRDTVPELTTARARLVAALDADGRETAPAAAARAQSSFDCWVEQQEENHQLDHIAACRDSFYSSINEVNAALEAKAAAERTPEPEPQLAPVLAARVPIAVVLFAYDSHHLDDEGLAAVDRVVEAAAATPEARLVLVGHTDRRGTEDYNLELSVRRAEAVRDALLARGVPTERLTLEGRGEADPAVPTADDIAEPANRRVEVLLQPGTAVEPISSRDPIPRFVAEVASGPTAAGKPARPPLLMDKTSNPMKTFIGLLASATARPSLCEDSQADGCPRPALEVITRREPSQGLAGIKSETRSKRLIAGGAKTERHPAGLVDGVRVSFQDMAVKTTDYRPFLVSSPSPTPPVGPWGEGSSPPGPAGVSPAGSPGDSPVMGSPSTGPPASIWRAARRSRLS